MALQSTERKPEEECAMPEDGSRSAEIPAPDGATRLFLIIGDPIAQAKSPGALTRALSARGRNAMLLPAHVTAAELDAFMAGVALAQNLDGIVVTVPHKFAAFRHCATTTERARFLGAVNVMRRGEGGWHGDMLDGVGLLGALRAAGFDPAGRRALLVGAGGAGTAIALALVEAGVAGLAIHDVDAARRDALLRRLDGRGRLALRAAGPDPRGHDLVVNATPLGMREDDPLPVPAALLEPGIFVADVVPTPEVTPLLQAARARGCRTQTGGAMYRAQQELLADFLLGG
jgi:shikimate dehydrogenase